MKKLHRYLLIFCLAAFYSSSAFSQYILNGSATQNSCNCYVVTPASNYLNGSVWNATKINLNNSFDFHFNVYLGCQDASGADGMVFILQPLSTSIGSNGEGMGFQGITPSIGITLDTWSNSNLNDPAFDHISIQSNGYIIHDGSANNLTPAVQASATDANIEDCQWHIMRITWDAATYWLRAYFDGSMRVEAQKDLVTDIFNNDPMVYWGFSAATGGGNNLQQFCTALDANFNTGFANNSTCIGVPVLFTDSSQSFTIIQSFYWDFGDGSTATTQNVSHNYAQPGIYTVKHVITGADGCISDTTIKTITIGAMPMADFSVTDTCANNIAVITEQSTSSLGNITQWTWMLDGNFLSNAQQPTLPVLSPGIHQLQLAVGTEYGCTSGFAQKQFLIKPAPSVDFVETAGCMNLSLQFNGIQIDNQTSIVQWNWGFDDGSFAQIQNPSHSYNSTGNYVVTVNVIAANGCRNFAQHVVAIGATPVAQFSVTDACEGNTAVVNNSSTISSGSITQWNWTLNGQPNSNSQIPSLSSLTAGNYSLELIATGNTGCTSNPGSHNFSIKNSPAIVATGANACYNQPVQFTASQTDNATTISQWKWNFGDGQNSSLQNPSHSFATAGNFNATVIAVSDNGCSSQPSQMTVKIDKLSIDAGNDTIVIKNVPFVLNASALSVVGSSLSYTWSPSTGLNNVNVLQPSSVLQDDIVYFLSVQSPAGCFARDSVKITVFTKSAIYVPSAFTPNNDKLNDVLLPKYIGIKGLSFFTVYNRWGELVFTTKNMSQGWDGTINGKQQPTGTFIWIIKAVDYDGKIYELKGTTTVVR